MKKKENWAIPIERVQDFFRQQTDVTETADGFCFRQCVIHLTPDNGLLMGKWQQPRTILSLDGPDRDTEEIYQRFFLRFLSAGG